MALGLRLSKTPGPQGLPILLDLHGNQNLQFLFYDSSQSFYIPQPGFLPSHLLSTSAVPHWLHCL